MWETWVQFLGWEDPLEKGMVTHSSILAWRIPWTEEPGGPQSMGSQSRTRLSDFHFHRMSKVAWNKPERKASLLGKRKRKKAGSQEKQRRNMISISFSLGSFSPFLHSFLPNLIIPSLPSLLLSFHCSIGNELE